MEGVKESKAAKKLSEKMLRCENGVVLFVHMSAASVVRGSEREGSVK